MLRDLESLKIGPQPEMCHEAINQKTRLDKIEEKLCLNDKSIWILVCQVASSYHILMPF